MATDTVHLALFKEDRVDQVAEAVSKLRRLGVKERKMSIISGVPYSDRILGRPMSWTRVPLIGGAGALAGIGLGILLNFGTPLLMPIHVGGQALLPFPPGFIVVFEMGMLGLMVSTFLGVVLEMLTPSYGPRGYHPKISDGYIGILFDAPDEIDDRMHATLTELGAEVIHRSEVGTI
jgi:hypothetical protein